MLVSFFYTGEKKNADEFANEVGWATALRYNWVSQEGLIQALE